MKLLRNIARKFASVPKKFKATALVAIAIATVSGAAYAGFTPANRPTFDWNNAADRKGSSEGPVLNSFVNTPFYGDERAFFDARFADTTVTKDVLPYVTNGSSKEVILRTYVHNNGNQDLNASGKTIAKDTKVRIDLPTATSTALRARSYITASNTVNNATNEVTDTAELVDATPFSISYVPGSAKIYNTAHAGGLSLGDNIVTTGAPIGYDQMNGNLPGCFEFQAFVEIRVRVNVPQVSIVKQVKNATDSEWKKATTAKPGETVKWLVTVKNTGSTTLDDVSVSDALPAHFSVVPGSVKRTDGANSGVAQNDRSLFTSNGINFTSYGADALLYVRFDTVVKDDLATCEARMQNQAFVKTKQTPAEIKDTADVTIKKDNCNVVTPGYVCDALTLSKTTLLTGEKFTTTAKFTATGGATFKQATFSFGDDKTFTTNTASNGTATAEHSYDKVGDYAVKVKLEFTVNGQTKVVEDAKCVGQVKVGEVKGVTTIPNTGTGSTIGIFAAVTAAGAFLHNALVRRSYRG